MASEASEQIQVVKALHALQVRTAGAVRYFHPPNGESRDRRTALKLKTLGVVPGVPDLMIVGRPPPRRGAPLPLTREEVAAIRLAVVGEAPDGLVPRLLATLDAARGTVIEMKTVDGNQNAVRAEQVEWLQHLKALGWDTLVGWGAVDALRKLKALGFPVGVSDGPVRE